MQGDRIVRRAISAILLVFLLLPVFVSAQDMPVSTPDPLAVPPEEVVDPNAPAEESASTPDVPISPIEPEALQLLINARTDLDILATQNLGASRPGGWSGSANVMDRQLPLLIRLDLEILAGTLMGPDQRPPGWFGAVPSTPYAIARDIRHDLELLANVVNPPTVRPPGWIGSDPIMRCDRATQTLVLVMERTAGFRLNVDVFSPDFCNLAGLQATAYAEANIMPNPRASSASVGGGVTNGAVQVSSPFAVAFLDRFGRRPTGTIPVGEPLTPIARSYTQFSRMMLVRGNGFEVFIDYSASTLGENQFAGLPDVNSISTNTGCNAPWCNGVG